MADADAAGPGARVTLDAWDVVVIIVDLVAVAGAVAYYFIRRAVIRARWPEPGAGRVWNCPRCRETFADPVARRYHLELQHMEHHHDELDPESERNVGAIGPDTGWL